jgi:hypothetical protein
MGSDRLPFFPLVFAFRSVIIPLPTSPARIDKASLILQPQNKQIAKIALSLGLRRLKMAVTSPSLRIFACPLRSHFMGKLDKSFILASPSYLWI